jgi:hypothetical protein
MRRERLDHFRPIGSSITANNTEMMTVVGGQLPIGKIGYQNSITIQAAVMV